MREVFKAEHGDHLPDDLCLSIENLPTKWAVGPVPWTVEGETWIESARGEVEVVPEVDHDLLADARERIANSDGEILASMASL
jgi:autophagy-related protein 17